MQDPEFRRQQREQLYVARMAPVNDLVDKLRDHDGRGWAPHVAPVHGGIDARVLWVLRDPGPAVADPNHHDRGFLCVENAAAHRGILGKARLDDLGAGPALQEGQQRGGIRHRAHARSSTAGVAAAFGELLGIVAVIAEQGVGYAVLGVVVWATLGRRAHEADPEQAVSINR